MADENNELLTKASEYENLRWFATNESVQNKIKEVETNVETSLSNEQTRATAAEETLQSNLDTEVANRKTAVETEKIARDEADKVLQESIDAEVDNRKAAVSEEQTRAITQEEVLQTNIDDEATARETEDASLKSSIETEIADRKKADEDEAAARKALSDKHDELNDSFNKLAEAFDTVMKDAETDFDTFVKVKTALDSAVDELNSNIKSTNEDTVSLLNTETERAKAAEEANKKAIDILNADDQTEGSVKKAAADAINTILGGVNESYDTLQEVADYIQKDGEAASEMLSKINANTTSIGTLNGDSTVTNSVDYKVAVETARAEAAEAVLQDSISSSASILNDKLDTKQDKLTAGDNVSISDDNKVSVDLSGKLDNKTSTDNAGKAIVANDDGSLAFKEIASTQYIAGDNISITDNDDGTKTISCSLKIVKTSQTDYDALVAAGTVDEDTFYIIQNS